MAGILVKPKYLLGHFLVLLIVVSCFMLSSWQFSRLNERRELNSKISSRMNNKAIDLKDISKGYDKDLEEDAFIKDNEYRRISVTGEFKKSGSVLILGRSQDGDPGYNIMVPMDVLINEKPKILFINVGFISTTLGEAITFDNVPVSNVFPKIGDGETYTFEGLIRKNEAKSLFGSDEQVQENKTSNRIDVNLYKDRIGKTESKILQKNFWVELVKYTGIKVVEKYPDPIGLPELSEKNHFSYAIQWVMFGFIGLITWLVICYKAKKSFKVNNPSTKGK